MASNRTLKLNKHIQKVFGEILQRDADLPTDVLVTISQVETQPNLRSANVWLYVYPETAGEDVLKALKPQMYNLQGTLNNELQIQPLPRIMLRLDHGAKYADDIAKTFDSLDEQ